MAVTLNANTSTGFIATSDTSGVLQLQTGGTTAVTISSGQVATFAQAPVLPSGSIPQAALAAGVAGTGPAFRAVRITSQQVIATATATKVQFNSETFDTNGNFDSTTNYRFTPTVAGYYKLNACLQTDSFASGAIEIYIYKNGSAVSFSNISPVTPANPSVSISDILSANGSTDYFEIYVYQNSGTNKNIYAGSAPAYCWFSGALIRSA